ncbi:LytR/AlgR family response regulator transcription factor [Maribacter sp. 2308TA10-17]|uniref:LytR/AlgR family response regulator transcription factor n=1 Tax=Maribacter sp. 2308TA10-17 TaxID=3386276 RepID=UPI0039BCB10D
MKTTQYALIGMHEESSKDLTTYLANLGGYNLVGTAENTNHLLDIILAGTPNLIFINVDNYSKKDFIEPINTIKDLYRPFQKKPRLVAIASSKKQAYNCIKNNFYYYLLQPINESQLRILDSRLRMANIPKKDISKKLCLQTYSDYRFIEIKDILYLKADNNSTEFFMSDKTKIVAYKTLKYFESILPNSFRRIHQSFVINQNYISRIHLGKHECHLKQLKMKLPFSRSYRKVMSELAIHLSSNALS